ncbi:MAG: filamentous hemagglutinin N-terminal domain-containing protein [Candidatus Omnitrophica bacterium]|nr:filamentous hemagglutinin N-terminal domain-containing protein [Candidatus Omnitrophota bacterium]
MSSKKINNLIFISAFLTLAFTFSAYGLPEGEEVALGSATFDRSTTDTLIVNTSSDKLIVNYDSFNIAQQEAVHFYQPSASSIALNRVTGQDPSSIMGTLTANGRVFIVNPNGVLFGPDSRVDVAALVASTLDISNEDFLAGRYNFSKDGKSAFITNQGKIIAQPGGYVCLLSGAVGNQGIIQANLGTVVLAAGEKVTLALDDLNQISVVIDDAVKEEVFGPEGEKIGSAIKNSGAITAGGGKVILNAKVLNSVFDYAINNTGIIQAESLVNHHGVVELVAEGAPVYNIGKIEAGEVRVEVKDSGFINKGEIITDGSPDLPDGGRVSIEAATVLQQGNISANAQENGTAGELSIVSQTSTVLDEGSTTEARALGNVGNGGKVTFGGNGKVLVNNNALIDLSGGGLIGDAGFLIGKFDQIGFYGVLNGRAPPGYSPLRIINTSDNPATISTDRSDYPPDGTPVITGSGFLPNQQVTINILGPDGNVLAVTVQTDASGNFVFIYAPQTLLGGPYTITATDGTKNAVNTFTDAPPPPTMTAEPAYTQGTSNAVSWTSVSSAVSYRVQRARDSSFTSGLEEYTTSSTNYDFTSLSDGQIYYYRVRAERDGGWKQTAWSDTVSSTQDATAPTITITAPINGTTYNTPQTLTYTVSDNFDSNPVIGGATSGSVYSAAGAYLILITAEDSAGNTNSGSVTFSITASNYIDSQLSYCSVIRLILPDSQQSGQFQFNFFIPGGPVYLYHPLTPIDLSAFGEFILEEGAYEFINGAINIIGHGGLLPFLK